MHQPHQLFEINMRNSMRCSRMVLEVAKTDGDMSDILHFWKMRFANIHRTVYRESSMSQQKLERKKNMLGSE